MPVSLDEAMGRLRCAGATFVTSAQAAERFAVARFTAECLLAELEDASRVVRVCDGGWVPTLQRGHERRVPVLAEYLHDMMTHLGVGYYLSYAAAAERRGASHHGVMRQRILVETDEVCRLGLREADGPADLAVSFHQIDPEHGRPASLLRVLCLPWPADGAPVRSERRTLRAATAETALLDMVERPDRCGGMDHVATIARKMLFWRLLHPVEFAAVSDRYEASVARRAGSMLQRLRDPQHRLRLGPLRQRVRRRPLDAPVALRDTTPDHGRKQDRWGVTCGTPLDPDA